MLAQGDANLRAGRAIVFGSDPDQFVPELERHLGQSS
jgi:hypothetical protein